MRVSFFTTLLLVLAAATFEGGEKRAARYQNGLELRKRPLELVSEDIKHGPVSVVTEEVTRFKFFSKTLLVLHKIGYQNIYFSPCRKRHFSSERSQAQSLTTHL